MLRFVMLSIAAVASLAFARPAEAQTPVRVDVTEATLGSVLSICVGVLDRTMDINNATELAEYGFSPGAAASEAALKASDPTAEFAYSLATNGRVDILANPGTLCLIDIQGGTRFAARDELLRRLLATPGVRSERHQSRGDDVMSVYFTNYTMDVRTGPSGLVQVVVKRPER